MNRIFFLAVLFFNLFLTNAQVTNNSYKFRLKNVLNFARENETVEIQVPTSVDLSNSTLKDENGNVVPFEITNEGKARFQVSIGHMTTKGFEFSKGTRVAPQIKTYAAVKMPTSRADIAWENDLCAYRMYNTVLLKNEPNTAQGVDVWQKKISSPVIDNMYSLSNYHAESQYGMDVYSVNGKRLGCGGTAPIVNGKLVMHNPYNSCEFIEKSNLKQVFKLTYDDVLIDGDYYKKTLIVECSANSLLNKATFKLEGKIKPIKIAVGIYEHTDMGITIEGNNYQQIMGIIGRAENKSEGSLTTQDARFYQGAFVPNDNPITQEIDNHLCLVVDYTPQTELTFYFGAGWNHFPQDKYPEDVEWFDELLKFKKCVENPLTITSYESLPKKDDVLSVLNSVNQTWQDRHPSHGDFFWNRAVYYIGNMHAYEVTNNQDYLDYATAWAERNNWSGRDGSSDPTQWKFGYGESYNYVLFGDNQVCFQVYADLYNLDPQKDPKKIARALEVMGYEISTDEEGYIWWVDGLFMVMPIMTKLYKITGNQTYLDKMYIYWRYYTDRMYDYDENLYYRDRHYVYPDHKTLQEKKDFWARGDGWIFAAFAKILQDLPETDPHRNEYITYYKKMAAALKKCQMEEGYWERSLLDPEQAPGYETSGTAFFTYGYAWGINNGYLSEEEYGSTLEKAWNYLVNIAYQEDGTVGYIQPIGSAAVPGQILYPSSCSDFGVGAFLMAAAEMSKFAADEEEFTKLRLTKVEAGEVDELILSFNEIPNQQEATDISNYVFEGFDNDIDYINIIDKKVIITFKQPIDYGCYKVKVFNIHTADGGEMAENQEKMFVYTVPLTPVSGTLLVSANGAQAGNPVENVLDNNLNTRWSMEGEGSWVLVDLGDVVTIEAVDIAFYNGNQRKAYFNILASVDGKSFQNVLVNQQSSGITNELERYKFQPRNARFVRVFCNGTSAGVWNSITEIRVRVRDNSIDKIVLPEYVCSDLLLPQSTEDGNTIVWTSSDKSVLSGKGFASPGDEDKIVTLTANVGSSKRQFDVLVKARNIWANLQLLYRFENQDIITTGEQSVIKDYSGHNRDALLEGINGCIKDGMLDLTSNSQFDFDNNGYLLLPEHLLDSIRSYSIAFMAKPDVLERQPRFYDFGTNASNSVFLRANQFAAGYKYNGSTTVLSSTTASQLNEGEEFMIAVTFDARTSLTKVYVNGEVVSETDKIVHEPYELTKIAPDTRNYIGRTQWWDSNVAANNIDYIGTLDEFHMFNIALTQEEIVYLFDNLSTDINDIMDNHSYTISDKIYDLSGRRVYKNNIKSGIYIVNGKKIWIRY